MVTADKKGDQVQKLFIRTSEDKTEAVVANDELKNNNKNAPGSKVLSWHQHFSTVELPRIFKAQIISMVFIQYIRFSADWI
ncbi:hypothetical protein D3C87_894320 [compost metagenome]